LRLFDWESITSAGRDGIKGAHLRPPLIPSMPYMAWCSRGLRGCFQWWSETSSFPSLYLPCHVQTFWTAVTAETRQSLGQLCTIPVMCLGNLMTSNCVQKFFFRCDTQKNLVRINPNQIVFTIFWLICLYQINRKMVNAVWFRFILTRFRKDFSVCRQIFIISFHNEIFRKYDKKKFLFFLLQNIHNCFFITSELSKKIIMLCYKLKLNL